MVNLTTSHAVNWRENLLLTAYLPINFKSKWAMLIKAAHCLIKILALDQSNHDRKIKTVYEYLNLKWPYIFLLWFEIVTNKFWCKKLFWNCGIFPTHFFALVLITGYNNILSQIYIFILFLDLSCFDTKNLMFRVSSKNKMI